MRKQRQSIHAISWLRVLIIAALPWAAQDATGQPADKDLQLNLKKSLLDAARKAYEVAVLLDKNGPVDPCYRFSAERFAQWSRRWLDAQLDLASTNDTRIAAYREHLDRMRELAQKVKAAFKGGDLNGFEVAASEYHRIQAELWLEQAKAKAPQK